MAAIPPDFQFSQASLHDFETCARRFQLRYLERLEWPGLESEPIHEAERLAQLGRDFHRLVHQHLVGLPAETLTNSLAEAGPDLRRWWDNYLAHRPPILAEAELYPELTLSTPLRGYRLMARFDLLALPPDGGCLIIDWKTARHKPSRDRLADRIQSRVYPYVLAAAGAAFNNGQPLDPAAIQMLYWYPQAPDQPERFDYNPAHFRRDERLLSDLIERIKQAVRTDNFPLVESDRPCLHCRYRSYCDRGRRAGPVAAEIEPTEPDLLDLDWDQIAEIQF